jgi:hypothetical protein
MQSRWSFESWFINSSNWDFGRTVDTSSKLFPQARRKWWHGMTIHGVHGFYSDMVTWTERTCKVDVRFYTLAVLDSSEPAPSVAKTRRPRVYPKAMPAIAFELSLIDCPTRVVLETKSMFLWSEIAIRYRAKGFRNPIYRLNLTKHWSLRDRQSAASFATSKHLLRYISWYIRMFALTFVAGMFATLYPKAQWEIFKQSTLSCWNWPSYLNPCCWKYNTPTPCINPSSNSPM